MDACEAVEKEINKVSNKLKSVKANVATVTDEVLWNVLNRKNEFADVPSDYKLNDVELYRIRLIIRQVREKFPQLASDHRDVHGVVSRAGKQIDRHFDVDYAATTKGNLFGTSEHIEKINKIICQHYYMQGMMDVADTLAKDAGLTNEEFERHLFTELFHIKHCLRNKDLEPAIKWAEAHRKALEARDSPLLFKLHCLKFIQICFQGPAHHVEAVSYARAHFDPFSHKYKEEIQKTMVFLLHTRDSIACSILDDSSWTDLADLFYRDACSIFDKSPSSPLQTCINAGCKTIPALLNIKQIMVQRNVSGLFNGKEELPIEIDLGEDGGLHSTFACPILRQQSSQNNPPMKLICGHVISKEALTKLSPDGKRIKCPYCPVESYPKDARVIYF